jgi:phosphoserine phosphatase RsbU/P
LNQKPTILIIDDQPVNIKLLQAIFRKEGFHTLSAANGPEGRQMAHRYVPDLILLDVMMPDENGFVTCSKLKLDNVTTNIPIIFVSAANEVEDKVKGLHIGGVDYISKPYVGAEVLARARLHIKLSQAHDNIVREQSMRLNEIQEAQRNILVQPNEIPEAQFAVYFKPVQEAGGDFYDVIQTSEGIFGYFIADISGHGLGASFITSALKALLRQNTGPLFTPLETIKVISGVLRSILKEEQYVTASYVQVNRLRSTLMLVNAGHPPVIFLPSEGPGEALEVSGDVLGAFDTVSFEVKERTVSTGDRFFLYSDGLIEGFENARRKRGEGIKQLVDALIQHRASSLSDTIHDVIGSLSSKNEIPEDDILLLGVEV